MILQLRDYENNHIDDLIDNDLTFGSYGPKNGYIIHIIDTNEDSMTKQINDISTVEKWQMSEEQYNARPCTFRKWLKNMKKTKKFKFNLNGDKITNPNYMQELASYYKINDFVEVIEHNCTGKVAYVGKIPELGLGYFIGIILNEPKGNFNGSVNNVSYFNCQPKYGAFVRPDKLQMIDASQENNEQLQDEIDEI